ncbi:hypothetical protein [Chondromyces apiculatus]|uniref:Lipoprotein n=1 Tax=Chondromyces apiculatus DSM 436 TaxID=1192034 RepID=A0A017T593_9BACT|nr:hypothetical protein [Chondromyces apiculatus]EYF04157.1 Hypothetical protein CAP_4840 [Chondromyces apiculatus DSM 436]
MMSKPKAAVLVALGMMLAACGGTTQGGTAPARPVSPGMWESEILDTEPREVLQRPDPPGQRRSGASLDGWLNTMPGGVSPAMPGDMPGAFEGVTEGGGRGPGSRPPAPPRPPRR